jgi:hypothetical protein
MFHKNSSRFVYGRKAGILPRERPWVAHQLAFDEAYLK